MEFKAITKEALASTREVWEGHLDELEQQSEMVRPSLYWSALDAASARVDGNLESQQFGVFSEDCSYAMALVAVHRVAHRDPCYLKIREIRLEPSLSYEIDDDAGADYFTRHRLVSEVVGVIIASVLEMANSVEHSASMVKIYGSTAVEIELFATVVASAKDIESDWGVKVSTHGHWLQFDKI